MALTIENLLSTMIEERKKVKSDEDDDDFVLIEQVNYQWPNLFNVCFLSPETRLAQTSTGTTSDDDLVFYVKRKVVNDIQHLSHQVEVFRHHDTKRQPKLGTIEYDWEETAYLNLVLHQFDYTLTTAVCIKTSSRHLQVIKRLSTKVYASPSRRDMENKGTEEKITYPNIYFTVDNFEDTFCEISVNEGQIVCVELVAKNPFLKDPRVLFLGSIKYEALKRVYDIRATASTRVAQRISLGRSSKRRVEFVPMRGPNGKGRAQMAVSPYRPTQSDTKTSESTEATLLSADIRQENWYRRHTIENDSMSQSTSELSKQLLISFDKTAAKAQSTDIRQELSNDAGNFLGRRLNQAMNWLRGSNSHLNQSIQSLPLQTCLTYLTLPCHLIVKDILEFNSVPILTSQ